MTTLKSIIIIILCIGGISVAVYDLITGKISDDPVLRKRVNLVLYIIFILLGIKLIAENIEVLLNLS